MAGAASVLQKLQKPLLLDDRRLYQWSSPIVKYRCHWLNLVGALITSFDGLLFPFGACMMAFGTHAGFDANISILARSVGDGVPRCQRLWRLHYDLQIVL
eukprot:4255550-Amphidinium_carterae.1